MKAIVNLTDAQSIYRIEAARLSFALLNLAFDQLKSALREMENGESPIAEFKDGLNAINFGFNFIDCTHRFFSVLSQIRGFRHKDDRYKKAESAANKLVVIRNFAQHLNNEIPKITSETYPILGAISWASEDRSTSRTLSLGALPPGTTFHSLGYDTEEKTYSSSIMLNIGNLEIDLTDVKSAMVLVHEYFSEWLSESNFLSDQDIVPNLFVAGPFSGTTKEGRYLRAKFLVGSHTHNSVATRK